MLNEIVGKQNYGEIKSLFKKLNEFSYVLVKGEALSLQAFGRCGARRSGDIDLLICKRDILKVSNILRSYGFSNGDEDKIYKRRNELLFLSTSHQMKPYKKNTNLCKIEIDLNFDIYWGGYLGDRIEMMEFLSNPQIVDIYGNKVKVLSPIKSMIHLILHHYREMNSIYHLVNFNSITTNMFFDVYCLLRNNREVIPVSEFIEICEDMKISAYAYYVFFYTKKCFNDCILDEYIERLKSQEGNFILNTYGLNEDERKTWKVSFEERLDSTSLAKYLLPDLTLNDIRKLKINHQLCKV